MSTEFDTGKLVISLDFELFWGVRDKRTIESYGTNILGVRQVIPALLSAFDKYQVAGTFSTVGFLFARNKEELLAACPAVQPQYANPELSPYHSFSQLGQDEQDDPWHFGYSLLEQVRVNGRHEIGTHTFCHYYCLEPGQTAQAFKEDLRAAKKMAAAKGINVRSLVFPRNQFNEEYLSVCREAGIDSYRGNPESWLYKGRNKNEESLFRRALRILDAYINISGYHCHDHSHVLRGPLVNVAASRFLRPYSRKLAALEPLRLRRIKKAMLHAARHKKLFHLWWHPHNFGVNLEQNMAFLEKILQYYRQLQRDYGFSSATMSGLTDELKQSR
ncbi:MAG: polysaccharide deacetylase family protein [Sphingobacteriales bacterium]|nr:polysaccharide deacetylase family protein [Sphingobacteriales bacterium]